jgi:hypothetical protein
MGTAATSGWSPPNALIATPNGSYFARIQRFAALPLIKVLSSA